MLKLCPVCSDVLERESQMVGGVSAWLHNCPNCGSFAMTEEVKYDLNEVKKLKLSSILRMRKIRGMGRVLIFRERPSQRFEDCPIPIHLLEEILNEYPENVSDRINESLMNLSEISQFPGQPVQITTHDKSLFFVQSNQLIEMQYILDQLEKDGLILANPGTQRFPTHVTVTVKGWNRIAELEEKHKSESTQAFVAMWFNAEVESAYNNAIALAIKETGYEPIRIDRVDHNNKICDEIIAKIKESKFVIADFTGDRGGVYFEAGYAMGLGKPVIWTCKADHLDKVHFDTRQYNHIVWETEEELKEKLYHRIKATIN